MRYRQRASSPCAKSEACAGNEMVLVASSRSARTALPREQNQPGRRLAQAAQPKGDDRPKCLGRVCSSNVKCVSAIVFFRSLIDATRPPADPEPSLSLHELRLRPRCPPILGDADIQLEFA